MKRLLNAALVIGALSCVFLSKLCSKAIEPTKTQIIAHELRSLSETASILYIAAHPDDENTQLITYFSRGKSFRTAYLSLTRGDGGQNLLGPEFGDSLGVARTQELLAARSIDGGEQFFSRARDFGYSKDYRQTLTKWDHEGVLSDIVRVIREFRPDIIITRFSPEPSGTHGHHTASAYLAQEAFSLSGDPLSFPEQLSTLKPWKARSIFLNAGMRNADAASPNPSIITLDTAGQDPETGETFGSLAARSRSMHKTQGFGLFNASNPSGRHLEYFKLLKGDPVSHDLFENIDCTWSRFPGGEAINELVKQITTHFDATNPEASVSELLKLRLKLNELEKSQLTENKLQHLDNLIALCLGLSFTTQTAHTEVIPGESVLLELYARIKAKTHVTWVSINYPLINKKEILNLSLSPGDTTTLSRSEVIPSNAHVSQPYWLQTQGSAGMFSVEDKSLIGRPTNLPSFPVIAEFEIEGQRLVVSTQPTAKPDEKYTTKRPAPLIVIAPVSLTFTAPVLILAPKHTKSVEVDLEAIRERLSGSVSLNVPNGWSYTPKNKVFSLEHKGDHCLVHFEVTSPDLITTTNITASAVIDSVTYNTSRTSIHYAHIPEQVLLPTSEIKALSINLETKGHAIGYLPGAGDNVAHCLEQMGYNVTSLKTSDLTLKNLTSFDTIVIGVRAFNTRDDLAVALPCLFDYVKQGGTVIDQYNTPNGLKVDQFTPYHLSLSRDLPKYRVTNENGPVVFLKPNDLALTIPNRITEDDFTHWVQERGLNFASSWDETHFDSLIACSDVNEAPLKGGLLVSHYGKGIFIYTGLSFFRQLPAGVPGAYRLMANLIALGK